MEDRMNGSWLLLVIGPFLAVVISRDLVAAWKHQCFRKGPSQLWDVPRATMPVVFWVLILGNILMVCLGVWVAATTAIELWGSPGA
jgi:hypothetical protein